MSGLLLSGILSSPSSGSGEVGDSNHLSPTLFLSNSSESPFLFVIYFGIKKCNYVPNTNHSLVPPKNRAGVCRYIQFVRCVWFVWCRIWSAWRGVAARRVPELVARRSFHTPEASADEECSVYQSRRNILRQKSRARHTAADFRDDFLSRARCHRAFSADISR